MSSVTPFRLSWPALRELAGCACAGGAIGALLVCLGAFALPEVGAAAFPLFSAGFLFLVIFPFVIVLFALVPGWPGVNDKYINLPYVKRIIKRVRRPLWVAQPADRPPRLCLA